MSKKNNYQMKLWKKKNLFRNFRQLLMSQTDKIIKKIQIFILIKVQNYNNSNKIIIIIIYSETDHK